jgi:uncharacterized protein (DUF1501 family)
MKRRTFIKASALATATLYLPNFLKASEDVLKTAPNKKLIVIQLGGGNDGLNTVVPYNNDLYYKARPQISIPKNEVLPLDAKLGLHPMMKEIKDMYDDGFVALINNVGYPEPDRSHFRSMDIWQSASGSKEYIASGWLGRYHDLQNSISVNDTLLLEIDDSLSLASKGNSSNGLALKDSKKLFNEVSTPFIAQLGKNYNAAADHNHDNVSYLYQTLSSTISSAKYIYQTSKIFHSALTYPNHEFGHSMKTIAELIISGVNTSIYYVSLGSFDTHFNQKKRQAVLLKQLSETMSVFMKDMKANGKIDDVLAFTFSEFGRRVQENASEGTDHGTANQIFLFGGGLKQKGILNDAPNLSDLDNGDLKYTVDFRHIYATILRKWLNTNDNIILGNSFPSLSFI